MHETTDLIDLIYTSKNVIEDYIDDAAADGLDNSTEIQISHKDLSLFLSTFDEISDEFLYQNLDETVSPKTKNAIEQSVKELKEIESRGGDSYYPELTLLLDTLNELIFDFNIDESQESKQRGYSDENEEYIRPVDKSRLVSFENVIKEGKKISSEIEDLISQCWKNQQFNQRRWNSSNIMPLVSRLIDIINDIIPHAPKSMYKHVSDLMHSYSKHSYNDSVIDIDIADKAVASFNLISDSAVMTDYDEDEEYIDEDNEPKSVKERLSLKNAIIKGDMAVKFIRDNKSRCSTGYSWYPARCDVSGLIKNLNELLFCSEHILILSEEYKRDEYDQKEEDRLQASYRYFSALVDGNDSAAELVDAGDEIIGLFRECIRHIYSMLPEDSEIG